MTSETIETELDLAMAALKIFHDIAAVDIGESEADEDHFRNSRRTYALAGPVTVGDVRKAALAYEGLAALSRAPGAEGLGSSTRMTSPASRSQTPLSAGQFAWISRPDVIAMLDRVAGLHADLALEGGENSRLREAMESAFTQAKYAVAFMPTAADQDTADVRKVLGIPPIDPDIVRRFGPPAYTEEQVKAYHAALSGEEVADNIETLRDHAIRWRELGQGSAFTIIDRQMLAEAAAAFARLDRSLSGPQRSEVAVSAQDEPNTSKLNIDEGLPK